jgi:hypothetical protein
MSIIAIAAIGLIAAIASAAIYYYYLSIEIYDKCQQMEQAFNEHQMAHNHILKYYDYRANRLDGKFDLVGDLIGWQNYLINDQNILEHELLELQRERGARRG